LKKADRGYKYRKEWNAANYKQINVALPPDLADAFKAVCKAHGEAARQVMVRLISEYVNKPLPPVSGAAAPDYSTLKARRTATQEVLNKLEELREAAEQYRDGIPENMYNRLENAENVVTAYDEAIAAMEDMYSG